MHINRLGKHIKAWKSYFIIRYYQHVVVRSKLNMRSINKQNILEAVKSCRYRAIMGNFCYSSVYAQIM